jgi:hypothetical protein
MSLCKAERGIYWRWPRTAHFSTHCLWMIVMGFYWALSNYGRSVALPALWLVASGFFFYCRYTEVLGPIMPKAGTPDAAKYAYAVGMLALGNAVPFVGPLTIDSEVKNFFFAREAAVLIACHPFRRKAFNCW